jgi:signal transduction histidine kinase/ActR/RegA family two-component response regulator
VYDHAAGAGTEHSPLSKQPGAPEPSPGGPERDALRRALEESERVTDRLRGLQRVTAALSAPLARAEIARAIAEHGLRLLGAMAGGISCLGADGHLVKLLAFGPSEQSLARYLRPPLDEGMPHLDAVRSRRPVWLESAQEIEASYPHLADMRAHLGVGAWAVVPLLVGDRVAGALGLRFPGPRRFEPDEREFLMSLASASAQALERARLCEEREEALRETTRALDEANRHKEQFLAMLAHELRNPLAAIAGAVELAQLRLSRGESVEGPFAVLERQVKNSSRLLDDMLDMARLTRGLVPISKERVRFETIVTDAVDAQRPLIASRGHQLTVSLPGEPLMVEGDATRLEQVVTNLLCNAAKYTPGRGRLAVGVERSGDQAVLRVRDSGLGMSRELLPRLFAPFVQADRSLARTEGGLGVGLALVRELVAMHGGTVEARSDGLGKGSEFLVRIPLLAEAREPARSSTSAEASPPRSPRRILLVEDNLDAAEMLSEVLTAAGHEVRTVHDGIAAISAAAQFEPEIALLDIGLPGIDGYEVARRLRAQMRERAPVLVALTGYGQEEDRRRSREAGMAVHLTKPFDIETLECLVHDLCEARGGPPLSSASVTSAGRSGRPAPGSA